MYQASHMLEETCAIYLAMTRRAKGGDGARNGYVPQDITEEPDTGCS